MYKRQTLLDVHLLTGRTHQIRVHTQFAGHPVVGDEKYGNTGLNAQFKARGNSGLCLHARKLSFLSPLTEQRITVEAPINGPMSDLIKKVFG